MGAHHCCRAANMVNLELPGTPPSSNYDGRCTSAAKVMSPSQQHNGYCYLMRCNGPDNLS